MGSYSGDPKSLRYQDVEQDQQPIHPPIRAEHAVHHHVFFENIAAIPGKEGFHQVAVRNHHPGREHDDAHISQVPQRDKIFEPVELAQRNRNGQNHGKSGIDRPGDEIGRKYSRMPAGNESHGKVKADHGVNRNDQRRRQTGQEQIRHLVAIPVNRRTAPAHRQHTVDEARHPPARPVAQGCKIRDQSKKPEEQRHGKISRDGKHVPH